MAFNPLMLTRRLPELSKMMSEGVPAGLEGARENTTKQVGREVSKFEGEMNKSKDDRRLTQLEVSFA